MSRTISINERTYFDERRRMESESDRRSIYSGLGREEWRNSLVAIDNETGEFVGIVAHNVELSSTSNHAAMDSPLTEEEEDQEALTPQPHQELEPEPQMLERAQGKYIDFDHGKEVKPAFKFNSTMLRYNQSHSPPPTKIISPANVYHDPDVRPRSREGSVLGEDTFAPPPVPEKTGKRPSRSTSTTISESINETESEMGFSDGEAIDGQVRTRAKHVEVHRPDLLRDDIEKEEDWMGSDISGSTIGGPVVQMWRKARGGKEGEKKRKLKKEQKQKQKEIQSINAVKVETMNTIPVTKTENIASTSSLPPPTPTPPPSTTLLPPSIETVNQVRAQRGAGKWRKRGGVNQIRTSEVQSIEDRVWQSALENGCLPIDAPYTHLPFQSNNNKKNETTIQENRNGEEEDGSIELKSKGNNPLNNKQQVQQFSMQGNSVLLEFLAGSKIVANILHENASKIAISTSQKMISTLQKPNSFTPTSVENIEQTGMLRYIPVLPDHLLWFFGLNGADGESSPSNNTTTPTEMITKLSSLAISAPTQLLHLAGESVSSVWAGVSYLASGSTNAVAAGNWVGTNLVGYLPFFSNSNNTEEENPKYLQDDQDYVDPDDLLDITQPGDEDANEWNEWRLVATDGGTIGKSMLDNEGTIEIEENWKNTPRPVYRRKKPIPSVQAGFQFRQQGDSKIKDDSNQNDLATATPTESNLTTITHGNLTIQRAPSNRYSIIHFDHQGIPRQALLHPGSMSTSM